MSDLFMRRTAPPDTHHFDAMVLGIPVAFMSNAPAVLDIAAEAYPDSVGLGRGDRAEASIRIEVRDVVGSTGSEPIRHERLADGLAVRGSGCRGVADAARRTAIAVVSPDLVRDRAAFRSDVLEALTWALITRLDRQPLHASAIALDGVVLLLHGPAGAGKSTLALAAARAGIEAVADDMVFLQSRPRFAVWTRAAAAHVHADAAARLGIDTRDLGTRVRNGVTKLAVAAAEPGTRSHARSGLCLLGPRVPMPRATALSAADAADRMDLHTEPGFDHFADTVRPLLGDVARGGAWVLEPSADPRASVPLLSRMLTSVAEGGR